jgi:S1-C subfamily serine protease
LVLGLGLASAGVWSATPIAPKTLEAAISAPAAAPGPGRAGEGYADVVAKVTPAVVTIRVESKASPQFTQLPQFPEGSPFGDLFGQRGRGGRQLPPQLQRGLGSGVIVSNDGYILTNNHVIDNATKIDVELSDRRIVTGKLIGADPASDLAVVKIDEKNLPVLAIGDSNAMRVGDVVLAVGNPLGVGQTVTMGIVSAKGRATGLGDGSYEDFLQTDAPINQGNSGGALVNTAGRAGRHQLADSFAVGRQHRHRFRRAVEHGEERDGSARDERARASRTARSHRAGRDQASWRRASASVSRKARS